MGMKNISVKKVSPYSFSTAQTNKKTHIDRFYYLPQVTFNEYVQIKRLHTWTLAHHLARKSNWMQIVADRHRFQRHIKQLEDIIAPILQKEHRNTITFRNGQN